MHKDIRALLLALRIAEVRHPFSVIVCLFSYYSSKASVDVTWSRKEDRDSKDALDGQVLSLSL